MNIEELYNRREALRKEYEKADDEYHKAYTTQQLKHADFCADVLVRAGVGKKIPPLHGVHIPLDEWNANQNKIIKDVWNIYPEATFSVSRPHDGYPGFVDIK